MRKALLAVALSLCSLCLAVVADAADGPWTITIVGSRDVVVNVRLASHDVATADALLLARDLNIDLQERADGILIRDSLGCEWRTAHGSMLLEGTGVSRPLATPVVVTAGAIYLPLEAIAEVSGRKLVVDLPARRALFMPASAPSARPDVRTPAGWQSFEIAKTAAERAEMRRLDGESSTAADVNPVKEILPATHESMAVEIGLGITQGPTGASDLTAMGTVNGVRVHLGTFVTFGPEGTLYRSGHLTLENPSTTWTLEAGDLLSDMRGLSRGLRVARHVGSVWHPSLSVYMRDASLSTDPPVMAYRDEFRIATHLRLKTEAASDGSRFAAAQLSTSRANVEAFFRRVSSRGIQERGGMVSYDVWRGAAVRVGAKVTTGSTTEYWYLAGLSVPISRLATVSLEQTRLTTPRGLDTNSALGIQVPMGRVRLMQRYQITDIAFMDQPLFLATGHRQLQSMASWSATSRLQFNYQLATQWLPGAEVRQWTELQSMFRLSRSTMLLAVTGFPELDDPQRFRVGLQQTLPHKFRLSIDFGRLPAFQNLRRDTADSTRLLVMVRRGFGLSTPARGSDLEGRVVDEAGRPVAGAPVSLGPYVTTSRSDGRFRFEKVPSGDFPLGVVKERLPAQFTSDGAHQLLHLKTATKVNAELRVVPLNAIHGRVYIDRNGNGRFDPGEGVPKVVLRLSGDNRATMTDATGSYGFYNLTPGPYSVYVDHERLSSELIISSDERIDVQLEAGSSRRDVDFRLMPREKPVVMQKLPK